MKNKLMYTLTGGGGPLLTAFTMAEILLSLTIIGVVAAITLPSLTGNINERTWNTQRKALYARMSQAIALMPALNGYGTLAAATASSSAVDNVAETFITGGLAKVLKINNVCGKDNIYDCGLSSKITNLNGVTSALPLQIRDLNVGLPGASVPNTYAAAFETANGESVLTFYNPKCVSSGVLVPGADASGNPGFYMKQHVCANFVFDLNGSKGPNTVGKDIGVMSVLYPVDSTVVMPITAHVFSTSHPHQEAARKCSEQDSDSRLPNIDELLGIYYNGNLLGWGDGVATGKFWSATVTDSEHAYTFGYSMGIKYDTPKSQGNRVQCVKR